MRPSGETLTGFEAAIAALAALADGGLAVALDDGRLILWDPTGQRALPLPPEARAVTALGAAPGALIVAVGSTRHAAADWQADLMERGASGAVWRVPLDGAAPQRLAAGLAWPAACWPATARCWSAKAGNRGS